MRNFKNILAWIQTIYDEITIYLITQPRNVDDMVNIVW